LIEIDRVALGGTDARAGCGGETQFMTGADGFPFVVALMATVPAHAALWPFDANASRAAGQWWPALVSALQLGIARCVAVPHKTFAFRQQQAFGSRSQGRQPAGKYAWPAGRSRRLPFATHFI
jgi:hypothetical protein